MLKIGLTGGIGCGKSTVTSIFKQLNVPVIDADAIAHQLVAVGQPALQLIQQAFGTHSLQADGSLNRDLIRELVFSNPEQKQKLEAIIHPLVYQTIAEQMALLNTPYCILSIPLLFETNNADFVNRVLVVDCPVTVQIERVQKRDNLTVERVQSIMDTQVSRAFRTAHAHDIIDNTKTATELAKQVENLHNLYLLLSTY
ncbi:MAG: dephospho-CoA kinase [Methylococcales bacterium]|nr:dephospho-CoA kinase [Methylococcales bacterium]